MGEYFGTDGIRGVAGVYPLDDATVAQIGYSLANELRLAGSSSPLIVIGRDTRESGSWIAHALSCGVRAAGGEVRNAGVITTPGVAYLTRKLPADAGVVISASHNSYEDNGIKVFGPTGQKLSEAFEQAIERDLKAGPDTFPQIPIDDPPTEAESTTGTDPLKESYFSFLRDEIGQGVDLKGLRIVVDCAHGASFDLAPALFSSLGAEVEAIHVTPNGRNINLDCGSLHPEELQRRVISWHGDLGIAFDGDADRMLLVDKNGRLLDGDYILYILAQHLNEREELEGHRVVATVMSNLGLEVALRESGIALARASVGDKYVLEELLASGGSLGGEQSGHIIFPGISLAGDGMITALEILRVIVESGRSLSELADGMQRYPQLTVNVPVTRKPPLDSVAPLAEAISKLEQKLGSGGRLLVRYSGTENLLRIMIEGQDEAAIRTEADSLAVLVSEHLGQGSGVGGQGSVVGRQS